MPFIDLPKLNGKTLPSFPCYPATKSPFTSHGFKDATTDLAKFSQMVRNQDFLYGVPTGSITGFDVLDIDPNAFEWERHQSFPVTRIHRTTRGGTHYFFNHNPNLRNSTSKITSGVDVRAEGGYVIWWPKQNLLFAENPIVDWPEDLLQLAISVRTSEKPHEAVVTPDLQLTNSLNRLTANECFALLSPDDRDEKIVQEIYLSFLAETERLRVTTVIGGILSTEKYSRESRFAITAAAKAMGRIENAKSGTRNNMLNSESYSLGRILIRDWTYPRYFIRALWRGAVHCRLVNDDGVQPVMNTILSGLIAGIRKPYPDLEDKE